MGGGGWAEKAEDWNRRATIEKFESLVGMNNGRMRTAGQNSWCSWEENIGIKTMKTIKAIRI